MTMLRKDQFLFEAEEQQSTSELKCKTVTYNRQREMIELQEELRRGDQGFRKSCSYNDGMCDRAGV